MKTAVSGNLANDGDAQFFADMEKARTESAAASDFYGAAVFAKRSAMADGLHPAIGPYGETRYTVQQGLKAASHTREDVAAILLIQHAILKRLDRLRMLAWICVAALGFICFRLS